MKINKLLSLILAFVMVMSLATVGVFAEDSAANADTTANASDMQADVNNTDDSNDNDSNSNDVSTTSSDSDNIYIEDSAEVAAADVDFTATPGDTSVKLAINIKNSDSDSYSYTVSKKLSDGTYEDIASGSGSGTVTADKLTNHTSYTFRVIVTKDGAESVEKEVTAIPRGAVTSMTAKTLKDYLGVTVKWSTVKGADYYNVYCDGKLVGSKLSTKTTKYYVKSLKERNSYKFYVEAKKTDSVNGDYVIAKSSTITGTPAQTMYYTFKIKSSSKASYYKVGTKKTVGKLKAGTTYTAKGMWGGRLKVIVNGKTYDFPRVYAKNISQKYTKSFNYTIEEAENIVNHQKNGGPITSRTNYMVWTNLYTQHIYFFKKNSNGTWTCIKDTETTTGKTLSPTPMGEYTIWKRYSKWRGLRYWSRVGTANIVSYHSWGSTKGFGTTGSGGCMRLSVSTAKWLYTTFPKQSKAWIY